jgi:hypothetical protein
MRAAPRACGREACQQAPAPEQTTGAIECDAAIEKCQCLVLPGVSNLCAACVAALIKSVTTFGGGWAYTKPQNSGR